MTSVAARARTAAAIGARNIARVAWYRASVRSGWSRLHRLRSPVPSGPFFQDRGLAPVSAAANGCWKTSGLLFGHIAFPVDDGAPDWLADPVEGTPFPDPGRDWWKIGDFEDGAPDIKRIWELSRFDWVVNLAQQARNGDASSLERLNGWLADWCACNPPYRGPNWKCGQEASIRVMHLALAAMILDNEDNPPSGLVALLRAHLQRIAPTIAYALAQDNNHGTSEAGALFIGGAWLERLGEREGTGWNRSGRKWLEERARRLVQQDGSFSQYSLNYHRLMLDTYCLCEVFRRRWSKPAFSDVLIERMQLATQWLHRLTEPQTGDAPNVGANDGARLMPLTATDYRDYRPTVTVAAALFEGARAWNEQETSPDGGDDARTFEDALAWLGMAEPRALAARPGSTAGDEGGFAVIRRGQAMVLMRYPRFRFRPGQADALHVDLWHMGKNLLRDGGTYSYNDGAGWNDYFGGVRSHNTIAFDDRDQMDRIGRFLFADWLRTSKTERLEETGDATTFGAGYSDRGGASHFRRISLGVDHLRVEDEISGFQKKALLRWRLLPGDWSRSGEQEFSCHSFDIEVMATAPVARCELKEGWESRYYLQKTWLPVLETEVNASCKLVTTVRLRS